MNKSWAHFELAIGFLLIAVSPKLPTPILYIITGLILVLRGFHKVRKQKKEGHQ